MLHTDTATVEEQLRVLIERNLIKEMEPGKWVRKVLDQKTGQYLDHLPVFLSASRYHTTLTTDQSMLYIL